MPFGLPVESSAEGWPKSAQQTDWQVGRLSLSSKQSLQIEFSIYPVVDMFPIAQRLSVPSFDLLCEVLQTKVKPNELRSNMNVPPLREMINGLKTSAWFHIVKGL